MKTQPAQLDKVENGISALMSAADILSVTEVAIRQYIEEHSTHEKEINGDQAVKVARRLVYEGLDALMEVKRSGSL